MNKHAHFDLVSAEKALRANIKATVAEGMRLASTDDDRRLVRLQGELEDFQIAFALWDMGRVNDGGEDGDPAAADALGYTIGCLIASFVHNSGGGQAALDTLMESLWRSCTATLSGAGDEDAVITMATVDAMQGGKA